MEGSEKCTMSVGAECEGSAGDAALQRDPGVVGVCAQHCAYPSACEFLSHVWGHLHRYICSRFVCLYAVSVCLACECMDAVLHMYVYSLCRLLHVYVSDCVVS